MFSITIIKLFDSRLQRFSLRTLKVSRESRNILMGHEIRTGVIPTTDDTKITRGPSKQLNYDGHPSAQKDRRDHMSGGFIQTSVTTRSNPILLNRTVETLFTSVSL